MLEMVLDTSVVVSAARSKKGASFQLITWLREGRFRVALSPALVFEYEALLRRQADDIGWTADGIKEFLEFVCSAGRRVQPRRRLRPVLSDPDDAFILELAVAAGVDYLVTLNGKDFAAGRSYGMIASTPGDVVRRMREQP